MNVRRFSSSAAWCARHFKDAFVKKAQEGGYRARSAFKLLQVLQNNPIINPGMVILDCGASPGSWSQVVVERLKGKGSILAVDLLPIKSLPGVTIHQADLTDPLFKDDTLPHWLDNRNFDVILSDMCPNISGVKDLDSYRSMELASIGVDIVKLYLKPGGSFLVKFFTGGCENQFHSMLASIGFEKIKRIKPSACRKESSEIYFLGTGFRPKV